MTIFYPILIFGIIVLALLIVVYIKSIRENKKLERSLTSTYSKKNS